MNTAVLDQQAMLGVNFNGIPTQMKQRNQWVLWRTEDRDRKATKVPYQTSGLPASTTSTFSSLSIWTAAATPRLARLANGRLSCGGRLLIFPSRSTSS